MMIKISSLDLAGIARLARAMVDRLPGGTTIGLVGTLGAGKTTLVQAIADAAGIDVANVTSPTFTLLQTHRGCVTIHHLDAYRLSDEDEFLELGVDELFEDASAWTLVEWADRVASVMPRETLWLRMDIDAIGETRSVTLSCDDAKLTPLAEQVAGDMA